MKIFKKIFVIGIIAVLALALFACSESEPTNDDGRDDEYHTPATSIFSVVYQGTKIELGANADSILNKLGEPNSRNEVGDCGGQGAQVRYAYSSMVIYVLEGAQKDTIDQITLLDDMISTSKGISIGDEESKVRLAYGEPTRTDGGLLYYVSGQKNLVFYVENGTVQEIDLLLETQ